MHWNRSCFTDQITEFSTKRMTNVCMKLLIKWTDFFENIFQLLLECWVFVLIQPRLSTRREIWTQEEYNWKSKKTISDSLCTYCSESPIPCLAQRIYRNVSEPQCQPYRTIVSSSISVPPDLHFSWVSQLFLQIETKDKDVDKMLAVTRSSYSTLTRFQLQITFGSIFELTNAHFGIVRFHGRDRIGEFLELIDWQCCIFQFWQFFELSFQILIFVNIKIVLPYFDCLLLLTKIKTKFRIPLQLSYISSFLRPNHE